MSRLPLAQVTLCAVDTRTPALSAQALLRSMQHVAFGRVVLFTRGWLPTVVLPGVEVVDVERIDTEADLALFLRRQLPVQVRSSHVLLTRWDAGVVDVAAWTDEFLVHDYVAPLWPQPVAGQSVGAGGFSLRSRRFLLATQDTRLPDGHPEDVHFGAHHRAFLEQVHGVSFAPAKLALRFAEGEDAIVGSTFGVLGAHHLPRLMPEGEILECIQRLPSEFLRSDDAARLLRALALKGMPTATRELLRRCEALGAAAAGAPLLAATSSVMGLITP